MIPLRYLTAAILAATVHETAHLIVLCCCRIPVSRILLSADGARIFTADMAPFQEFLCAFAGPLGSLSLLFSVGFYPEIALFGLLQGIVNLLPVYPLDGGRILHSLCCLISADYGERLTLVVSIIGTGAALTAMFLFYSRRIALLIAIFLMLRSLPRKIPCKDGLKRVQ